ncbi:hypothetical protein HY969_01850 [Candidatus Kaiserbacteria bacterium]|nr:hypothetical protein [Candidatus Kaiserbacteria bacterium]
MDFKDHTHPDKLERYSFLWSEVRLVVGAAALLLGGVPPVLYFLAFSPLYGLVYALLKLAWVISGVASAYLVYRWYQNGMKVFGGNETKDTVAFAVSIASGLNLGFVGIAGTNIGMSITSNYIVFVAAAVLYLAVAYHLYTRWKKQGEKLF